MKTSIASLLFLSCQVGHSAVAFYSTNTTPHNFTSGNGMETLTVNPTSSPGAGHELRITASSSNDRYTTPDFLLTKNRAGETGDRWVEYHLATALAPTESITLTFEFYHTATGTLRPMYSGDGRDHYKEGPWINGNTSTTVLDPDPSDSRRINPVSGDVVYRLRNNGTTIRVAEGNAKELKAQLYIRKEVDGTSFSDLHEDTDFSNVDFTVVSTSTLFDNGTNTIESLIDSTTWDDGLSDTETSLPGPYFSSTDVLGNTVTYESDIGTTDNDMQLRAALFHDVERSSHEAAVTSTTMTLTVNSGDAIAAGTVFQFTFDGNFDQVAAVPEPSSLALLALVFMPVCLRRKR